MKFQKIFTFIIFMFLANNSLYTQEIYRDSLFEEIETATYTYFTKPGDALKLDIFLPEGNDAPARPVILYVHGGGFSGGIRNYPNQVKFCRKMAAKGYVTATMDYTLHMKGKSFGCEQPAPKKVRTFLKTSRDVNRATAFLLKNHSRFAIDTNAIVIAGSSAGAEAVLHTAYWRVTRKNAKGRILSQSFAYGGVISMAGAISNLHLINSGNAIPTQLFHGTCDNLVPYGEAPHHYCPTEKPGFLMLYGAHAIMERLRSLGKGYFLVTACNGGHEWNSRPITHNIGDITDFLYHDVVNGEKRQLHFILPSKKDPCPDYGEYRFCE